MIIMEGNVIKGNLQIGEDSLVLENTVVPDGWMAYGNPAKPIWTLTPDEIESNRRRSAKYISIWRCHI